MKPSGSFLAVYPSKDFNDITTTSCYQFYADDYVHAPFSSLPGGYVITIASDGSNWLSQKMIMENDRSIYERIKWNGTWSSWVKVAIDIPDFYKNYGNLLSLASAMCCPYTDNVYTEDDQINNPTFNGNSRVTFGYFNSSAQHIGVFADMYSGFVITFKVGAMDDVAPHTADDLLQVCFVGYYGMFIKMRRRIDGTWSSFTNIM